jgi:hypothetical protein
MSPIEFRNLFLENILSFLWRQWSALGVLGEAKTEDPWAIDPEPMILFTLEIGRCEPRLFDEMLDWLVVNGRWIDIQRLRGILRQKDAEAGRLTGALAGFLTENSAERKWQNLIKFCEPERWKDGSLAESLFFSKDGKPHPKAEKADLSFLSCGFDRPEVNIRRLTREVPVTAQSTIRFLLRGLFGVGSRAECLAYLLTHEGGHPAEVAKAIGLSVRGTQDALIDLSKSRLVLTRVKGKRKIEYWLSHERWWEFLSRGSITEIKKPVWIDWISLYGALSKIWRALNEIRKEELSDYLRTSRLREGLEAVGNEFAQSGLDIPPIPGRNVGPREYEEAFGKFIMTVFGKS